MKQGKELEEGEEGEGKPPVQGKEEEEGVPVEKEEGEEREESGEPSPKKLAKDNSSA